MPNCLVVNSTAGTRSRGPAGKAARPQAVLPWTVGSVVYCSNEAPTVAQVISPLGPPVTSSAPTLGTLDDSYDKFRFNPVSTVVLASPVAPRSPGGHKRPADHHVAHCQEPMGGSRLLPGTHGGPCLHGGAKTSVAPVDKTGSPAWSAGCSAQLTPVALEVRRKIARRVTRVTEGPHGASGNLPDGRPRELEQKVTLSRNSGSRPSGSRRWMAHCGLPELLPSALVPGGRISPVRGCRCRYEGRAHPGCCCRR